MLATGKAERRYAGVSHIDAERVLEDEAYAKHILDYAAEKNVEISSLAYYPNTLDRIWRNVRQPLTI